MAISNIKVKLNRAGVGQLLKCGGMQSLLQSRAVPIAGAGGKTRVFVAGTRAVGVAVGDNKDNAMLKRIKSK